MTDDHLARAAYAAYKKATGGLNFQGLPMPAWDDLGDTIQRAWIAAAESTEQAAITTVQGWMALDLHSALGLPVDPAATNQGHESWADWWAELCGGVRLAAKSRDDALRAAVAKIRAETLLIADDAPRVHQWMTFGMKTAADSIDPDWDAMHPPATTEARDV
jgi:hypothetical protein